MTERNHRPDEESEAANRDADKPPRRQAEVRPGRTPNDIGMTSRSDVNRESGAQDEPAGRGAMAFGGRGDAGLRGSAGGLGGKGRGSEGGTLSGGQSQTGGLGGEGRGSEGLSPGGTVAPELRRTSVVESDQNAREPVRPRTGPIPDPAPIADVSEAGGSGEIGAEDRLADTGIRDQGGVGRESQADNATESGDDAEASGPVGDDQPVRS
jgi:hypothetical protein